MKLSTIIHNVTTTTRPVNPLRNIVTVGLWCLSLWAVFGYALYRWLA
jgi:uncharacterized membrane protein (GlpM family)